jgi:methanethiol S-methyltransferase
MLKSHLLVAGLWILYCVLHSVLASLPVKNVFQKLMKGGFNYYRFLYTVFAFAGLAAIIIYQISVKTLLLFHQTLFIQMTGAVIGFTGLAIMAVCILKYFMQLSGVRWLTKNKQESKLMVDTLHKRVRHPLYSGTFLFIWGLLLVFPVLSLLIADIIITAYTLIGIRFEEKKLIQEFGESYTGYRKKVPMIIPDLKFKAPV